MRPYLIALAIILAMVAISAVGWTYLPDGALVPVHFGLHGEPNRFTDKDTAILQLPIAAAFAIFLFWLAPKLQPKRYKRSDDSTLLAVLIVGVTAVLGVGHAYTVWSAISKTNIDASYYVIAIATFSAVVMTMAFRNWRSG